MKKYYIIVVIIFLISCSPSGYEKFYYPYLDVHSLTDVEKLSENEEPKLYGTDNFERDIYILRSKNYYVVGYSSFNGAYEDLSKAKEQAKRIGAAVILTSSEYTNTLTSQIPLFIPQKSTTTYKGSVTSNNNTGFFSGKSTTTSTSTSQITTHQMRYDQSAVYFIKSTKKLRFGIFIENLKPEDRISLQRNTGAKITLVVEDTPCFYANLLPGDILLKIGDSEIKNYEHALNIMDSYKAKNSCKFTILREGEESEVTIDLE